MAVRNRTMGPALTRGSRDVNGIELWGYNETLSVELDRRHRKWTCKVTEGQKEVGSEEKPTTETLGGVSFEAKHHHRKTEIIQKKPSQAK